MSAAKLNLTLSPTARGLNQLTFQTTLLHDLPCKWPNSKDARHLCKVFRSIYRQRPWFLNKSLIPSSGLKFEHKCCWKSSRRCSDVPALGSQGIGSVAAGAPIQEAGIRLSVELSAGCKAKKQETHTFQTNTNSYTKRKTLHCNRSVNVATGQEFRQGEKSSVKGTTKEVLP